METLHNLKEIPITKDSISFVLNKTQDSDIKSFFHDAIDSIMNVGDKCDKYASIHLAHMFISKIALLMVRKVSQYLRYIATPIFVILGIYYYSRNTILTKDSVDPFLNAQLIYFFYNATNIFGITSRPQHYIYKHAYIFEVPCKALTYSSECPMYHESIFASVHKVLSILVENEEYSASAHMYGKNQAIFCPLPDNFSIPGDNPISLDVTHDIIPFIETFLWYIVMGVIILSALIEDISSQHDQITMISTYIKRCNINSSLSFLKKYTINESADLDYINLIMRSLITNTDFAIPIGSSLNTLSQYFSTEQNTIHVKSNLRRELDEFISNEKINLSKLLTLQDILSPLTSTPIKIKLPLLVILSDIFCFALRCHPYGMIIIACMHLILLNLLVEEQYCDYNATNTSIEFSYISDTYSIIEKLPIHTQKALIKRLAIECIYYKKLPIRKNSIMEKVIMVVNHHYNGSQLRSLLSILDKEYGP